MKRTITLAIAVTLLFTLLAGCAGTEQPTPSQNPGTTDASTADAPSVEHSDIPPTETTEPSAPETDLPGLDEPLFLGDTYNYAYHYVNRDGEILSEVEYPQPFYAENGLGATASPINGLVGFVDKEGVFVIEPQFEDAGPFGKDGLAPVAISVSTGEKDMWGSVIYEEKWGFINEQGEIVIPCEYDQVSAFNDNGYALVSKTEDDSSSSYGVIDTNGTFCIPIDTKYKSITLGNEYVLIEMIPTFESTDTESIKYYCSEVRDYTNKTIDSLTHTDITPYISEEELDNYSDDCIFVFNEDVGKYIQIITEPSGDIDYIDYWDCIRGDIYKHVYDENGTETIYLLVDGECKETRLLLDYNCTAEKKQVATTQTGYGYKIIYNGTDLSSYEYDKIQSEPGSPYLFAFKYRYADGSAYTMDIFDLRTGTKTAEDIPYVLASTRYDAYIPEGYYFISAEHDGNTCYGVIDYTGRVIMEPVYENIIPYTYETLAAGI